MNRRQVFALTALPTLGLPSFAFASDWRVSFLQMKLKMLREIAETLGNHEPQKVLIHACDSLLLRTDEEAEADKIRMLAMINEGRASRGAPPITEFDR